MTERRSRRKLEAEVKDLAREEATKVANRVANERALNPDFGDIGDDSDSAETITNNLFGKPSDESAPDGDGYDDDADIFEMGNDFLKKGTYIKFHIKKNGQVLATKDAPYSMEELQTEFGGGNYHVAARDGNRGFVKAKRTFTVAQPKNPPEQKTSESSAVTNLEAITKVFSEQAARTAEENREMLERLLDEKRKDDEAKEKREAKEEERRLAFEEKLRMERKDNENTMAALITALVSKPAEKPVDNTAQMMQMFQQMQTANNQQMQLMMTQMTNSIKEVATAQSHALERQSDNTRHMVETLKAEISSIKENKKTGILDDPLQLFNFLSDIKDKEYERGKEIGEALAGNQQEPQKKSLTEIAVENLAKMAPVFAMTMQQQAQAPQAPVSQPVHNHVPVQSRDVVVASPQTVSRPSLKKPAVVKTGSPVVVRTSATPVAQKPAPVTIDKKAVVIDTCTKVLGEGLMHSLPANETALRVGPALLARGVSVEEGLALVSKDEVFKIAASHGLPVDNIEVSNYLSGFYDTLSKQSSEKSGDIAAEATL